MNNISSLIDDKFGLIKKHGYYISTVRGTNLYHYYAFTGENHYNHSFTMGKGVSSDIYKAQNKAYGESIERYCSAFYDYANLIDSNFTNTKINLINIDKLSQYKYLYKNNSLINNSTIKWVKCKNLNNHKTTYIPASLVLLPYKSHKNIFQQNISTGLACHDTFTKAAIAGICEILERDAFMIMWRGKNSPIEICENSLSDKAKYLINQFRRNGYKITIYSIAVDIKIPIILAVMQSVNTSQPAIVVSAACKANIKQAITAAIEELELSRAHACLIKAEGRKTSINYTQIQTQKDHMTFWLNQKNSKYIDFILNTKKSISMEDIQSDYNSIDDKTCLEMLIDNITQLGMSIYYCDLTTDDVRPTGLFVLRIIIPEAHPLAFGYKNETVNNKRLARFTKTRCFNPIPHPLP